MTASLSIVVHGESGQGKTWLGVTAPTPRLLLDVESRARFAPAGKRIVWDPYQPIPDVAGVDTVVVKLKDFGVMNTVYQWLASGQHPFKSVIFDSITELQKRAVDSIAGTSAMETQGWGELLRKMESLVRSFRDLADPEGCANPLEAVVFIAGTHEKGGKQRPLLQGGLANTLPYHVDVCGYQATFASPEDPTQLVRGLIIQPQGSLVAKDGTDILTKHYGPVIYNPNITEMLGVLDAALGV